MKGKIAREIKGDNGFGWDKVFIPNGYNENFAEMKRSEKNKVSHRKQALDKLSDFISKAQGI